MSERPHVHVSRRITVHVAPWTGDLPDPDPQHAEVTVDLRAYWPRRGTRHDAHDALAAAYEHATEELHQWFDQRDQDEEQECP